MLVGLVPGGRNFMCQTQKFTIRENTDFNSLEISFTGIPDQETRNKLKALGFRWNP